MTSTQPQSIAAPAESVAPAAAPAAALLCETCGYVIDGLPTSGPCSECGRPVADSLPERRTGTAWQRSPGVRSWFITNFAAIFRRRQTFDTLRADNRGWRSLLIVNLIFASLALVAPWAGVLAGDPMRTARNSGISEYLVAAFAIPIEVLLVALFLYLLTWIEARGIRFFGGRRGWRITAPLSWQICAHASIGWTLAAVLMFAGLAASVPAFALLERLGALGRPGFMYFSLRDALGVILGAGGFFIGLLVFETLVYIGVRRCRYANPPRT